ncbi:hypothetical protein ACP4OV_010729 [Aristida adscensionis]
MKHLVKATAVSAVVAATAAAGGFYYYYLSTPLYSADLLSSTPLLWIAANAIIIWLFSSSRRGNSNRNATTSSPASHAVDVLDAVGDLCPSPENEAMGLHADTPTMSMPNGQGGGREARTARRPDHRRRLRSKKSADEEAVASAIDVTAEVGRTDDDSKRGEEMPAAADARADDGDDISMDSLWQSIVQRRAARPVAVRQSETWGSEELPRLHGAAATAAAQAQSEMRKFASPVAATPARPLGWRTRDARGMAQDELLRRAESFIRRQHEQLRLQRQESEQRHRPAAALVRV